MPAVLDIKQTVVETGKKLLLANLTVRTWGNISMRIDGHTFAITPSGYSYDNLEPKDIVILNIKKPETSSGIKPSSERYIHAEIYKSHPAVNCIIHTHQKFATALSLQDSPLNVHDEKLKEILGDLIPVAKYAPAGTKKIAKSVASALKTANAKSVLMANHGAVCFGESPEAAFLCAETLEAFCKDFIFKAVPYTAAAYRRYEKKALLPLINFYSSKRDGRLCAVYDKASGILICKMDIESGTVQEGYFDFPSDLHRKIYAEYPEINFIEQSPLPITVYASRRLRNEGSAAAFLDDFAQIAGENIFCSVFFDSRAAEFSDTIVKKLKNKNAVIIAESGALCCVSDYSDMYALQEIIEKNLLIKMISLKYKNYLPLELKNAKKLRKGYISGYSKIAFLKKK